MKSVCLYFEVHQPMRLNHFTVFSIGATNDRNSDYFNQHLNQEIFEKIAKKCKVKYKIVGRQDVLPYAPRISKVRIDIKVY